MKSETEYFLSGIYHPVNRSNLVAALAVGTVMQVGRLPVDLLPTVVLLAVIGVRRYKQQVIDDYTALLKRMTAVMDTADVTRTVQDTGERFNHPSFNLVSCLVYGQMEQDYGAPWLDDFPEAYYMVAAYEELVNNSAEALFPPANSLRSKRR
jgi:hypothetical protein